MSRVSLGVGKSPWSTTHTPSLQSTAALRGSTRVVERALHQVHREAMQAMGSQVKFARLPRQSEEAMMADQATGTLEAKAAIEMANW